jgi:hypothetical protein
MVQNNSYDADHVSKMAESMGLPYQIRISQELIDLLNPNEFLAGLGIHYADRIKMIFTCLKGGLTPKEPGSEEEAVPKEGIIIPLTLVKGPFIKEELVSVKAELTDDGSGKTILLAAIHEED